MNYDDFKKSLTQLAPPVDLEPLLKALLFDAKGDWNKAHDLAQEVGGSEGAWVHAYLHRKEGDPGNASYWYSNAGKEKPEYSLEQEWESLAKHFLTKS